MQGMKPRLGASACLLGQLVRYDGGHRFDPYLTCTLGPRVEFVPVCPEAELGLGVPREPIRLEGDTERPRLVTVAGGADITERMEEFAARRVDELAAMDLHGFIFKSRSPSCGVAGVKVFARGGGADAAPIAEGSGFFARALVGRLPLLPVVEDGWLHEPSARDDFIERVFVYARWVACRREASLAALRDFHERHKLVFMARSPEGQHGLGRVAGEAESREIEGALAAYEGKLAEVMRTPATPGRHENALLHALGYLKRVLTAEQKNELLHAIARFKRSEAHRLEPATLIDHYSRLHAETYLARQWYLRPDPAELALRCHA